MAKFTSLAKSTLITSWMLTACALLSIGISVSVHRRLGTVDVLVIMAFIFATILVSISTWAIVDEGQGKHQKDVPSPQLERMAKSLLVSEAIWSLVNGLVRISASLFLEKLFSIHSSAWFWALGTTSFLLALAALLQVFLICRPFAANWDREILGKCGDQVTSFMVLESVGLLLDLAILAIPVWSIRRIHLRLSQRIGIIICLDAGIVVLIVSALRMHALHGAVSPDFSYSQSYLSLLSAAGAMTGIICCAAPSIPALYRRTRGSQPRQTASNEAHIEASDTREPETTGIKQSTAHDSNWGGNEDWSDKHSITPSAEGSDKENIGVITIKRSKELSSSS